MFYLACIKRRTNIMRKSLVRLEPYTYPQLLERSKKVYSAVQQKLSTKLLEGTRVHARAKLVYKQRILPLSAAIPVV